MFDDLNQLINAMFPANFLRLKEDLSDPGYNLQVLNLLLERK